MCLSVGMEVTNVVFPPHPVCLAKVAMHISPDKRALTFHTSGWVGGGHDGGGGGLSVKQPAGSESCE